MLTAGREPAGEVGQVPVKAGAPVRADTLPPIAAHVLALQRAAGNRAVSSLLDVQRCGAGCTDHAEEAELQPEAPVVQRADDGVLGSIGSAVTTAGKAATFAAEIAINPSVLPKRLAEGVWNELSDDTKGLVIDKVLHASKWLVENGPINLQGQVSFMARLIQHALIGFLGRAVSYDTTFKIRLADRMLNLLANPSPEFSIGYLIGFVKGLWDGLTGPFVLIWDIVKLQWKIMELEGRLVAAIADTDQRKILVDDTRKLIAKVEAMVGPALQEVLSGKTDPKAILKLFDALIESILGQAQGVGRSISDALVRFLQQPDRQLGEGVGWVSGVATFELLLLALTEGGYTAVKEAVTGVKWVAEALEAAARIGARAEAMLAPMIAALRQFRTMLSSYKGLAGVGEVLEDIFNLFVKFLKMSYGLEGGAAARGAGKVEGPLGAGERRAAGLAHGAESLGVRAERKLVNALGESHEIKILIDGRIMRCSVVCKSIADNLAARAANLPAELQKDARLLVLRAQQLEKNSARTAAQGLKDADRMRELDAFAEQSVQLEQRMSQVEQKAGISGVRPSPPFTRTQQELDDLARDPANRFQISAKSQLEAQIGLDLENRGVLQGPIRRDIQPDRAEFVDINNALWDIKGFDKSTYSRLDAQRKIQAELNKGENVILDLGGLDQAQIIDLQGLVASEPGWAGRVIFWP